MSIAIVCPNCGKAGAVPDRFAGRQIKCRACETRFVVSQADSGATALDDELPPGLESSEDYSVAEVAAASPATLTPTPLPVAKASPELIPLQPEPEPPRPSRPDLAKKSAQSSIPPATPSNRVPNALRGFLFFLFKLVLAALILGYTTALAALPVLQEGTWLYAGLGGFAVLTLLYLVLIRMYYRAYPRAFPDRLR